MGKQNKVHVWITWGLMFLICPTTYATLTPKALAQKCYMQLTHLSFDPAHPMWAQINTTDQALNFCDKLIDNVNLQIGSNVQLNNMGYSTELQNKEAFAILSSFQDLHRTWFKASDMNSGYPKSINNTTQDIYDGDEGALHYTLNALSGAQPSDLLNKRSLDPIRENPNQGDTGAPIFCGGDESKMGSAGSFGTSRNAKGALLGIRNREGNRTSGENQTCLNANDWRFKIDANYGGGPIGTPSYFLMNLGIPSPVVNDGGANNKANGAMIMGRRWSMSVLSDLMCRDIPVLRMNDVQSFVQSGTQYPPFRRASACMQCHVTIDPLAAGIRNLGINVIPIRGNGGDSNSHLAHYVGSLLPAENDFPFSVADADFYRRPARGQLHYRSFTGEKIGPLNFTNLEALSELLKSSQDVYACTVSRYYGYFVGIRFRLQDFNDPALDKAKIPDSASLDFVKEASSEMKSGQSVKKIIKKIFRLPAYLNGVTQ